jgi:hypothetical protein
MSFATKPAKNHPPLVSKPILIVKSEVASGYINSCWHMVVTVFLSFLEQVLSMLVHVFGSVTSA